MKGYLVATSVVLLLSFGPTSARAADGPVGCDLDMVSPAIVQACVEQWLQRLAQWLPPPGDPQARRLFEQAERDRQSGALQKALGEYQRVHLLTPTTPLGRLAIDRLSDVERRLRESSEESEPPAPNESRRDLRDRCEPLGLVKQTY